MAPNRSVTSSGDSASKKREVITMEIKLDFVSPFFRALTVTNIVQLLGLTCSTVAKKNTYCESQYVCR